MNQRTPQPLKATELEAWLQKKPELTLVDVREHRELAIAAFPYPVEHLPLSAAEQWMGEIDQRLPASRTVVVICHAGVRSWNFGCWLLERNPSQDVWNLEGGIDAWSLAVDSTVPRY